MSEPMITKHEIVRMLRNAGLPEVAEEAERSLRDEVELDRALEFGARHDIARDELISRMGGSPLGGTTHGGRLDLRLPSPSNLCLRASAAVGTSLLTVRIDVDPH
jgi:hypothetical protein